MMMPTRSTETEKISCFGDIGTALSSPIWLSLEAREE
jgi:hypothetical protein